MNERYGRSVCAGELLLRNTIIQKMVSAWAMVGAFHLPDTLPGTDRIGKAQTKTPTVENSLGGTQPGVPAREGPSTAVTPALEVELDNTQSTAPTVLNSQEPTPKAVIPEVSDPKLV